MGTVRCTKKLLKELRIDNAITAGEDGGLGGWHANLFLSHRRKCVLFIHDRSLYSLLLTGLKRKDFDELAFLFGEILFKTMRLNGFSQKAIERMLTEYEQVSFASTNSRSVLGSMNDRIAEVRFQLDRFDSLEAANIGEIRKLVNEVPMGALKYAQPVEELARLLGE